MSRPRVAGRMHTPLTDRRKAHEIAAAYVVAADAEMATARARAAEAEDDARVHALIRHLAPFSGIAGARRRAEHRRREKRYQLLTYEADRSARLAAVIPEQRKAPATPSAIRNSNRGGRA